MLKKRLWIVALFFYFVLATRNACFPARKVLNCVLNTLDYLRIDDTISIYNYA